MQVSLRFPDLWKALFTVIFLLVIKLLLTLWKYVHRRVKYNKLIPGKKYSWFDPFGSLRETRELVRKGVSVNAAFFQILCEHSKSFPKHGIFSIWLSYMPLVVFVKAEAVEALFRNEDPMAPSFFYSYLESLFGTGLITSSGKKWKSRRKLLSPCFHSDVLRDFVPTFSEQSQLLVKCLKQHNKGEFMIISPLVTRCVLEIILKTIFGVNIDVQEGNDIQYLQSAKRIRQIVSEKITNVFYQSNFLFSLSEKGRKMNTYLNDMRKFTRTIIQEKKNDFLSRGGSAEKSKGNRKALMDFLIENHIVTQELGEEDIREEVDTFVAAGMGTVSTSICWSLYLIGIHQDVLLNIQEELFAVFGNDAEAPVKAEDLKSLTYLDCVVKESKRLYSTVPGFVKTAGETFDVSGSTVPKGAACLVLTYLVHRDEEHFPNPEHFDPDRFLPENCAKRHTYAYLPFSLGPRNCIGGKFAEMEEKVILATILRHFSVESEDQGDNLLSFEITLRPTVPIRIKLTPRC